MKNKSFTLIELLVVIVIIGILAGVIMISTSSSINKANIAKLKVFEESVANDLAANMVSRWKLDGNANDSWGSNNGTASNVTFLSESNCASGGCASFNGSSSSIDCGNNNSLSIEGNITVSAWIKPNSITDYKMIASKSRGTTLETQWELRTFNNRVEFLTSTVSGLFAVSKTGLLINDWQHVVGTINNNVLSVYLNGIKGVDSTLSGTKSTTNHSTKIGTRKDASETSYIFNGLIDDVRIYDAALSLSQIKQNYIAGLSLMLANGNMSKEEYNQRIESLASNTK